MLVHLCGYGCIARSFVSSHGRQRNTRWVLRASTRGLISSWHSFLLVLRRGQGTIVLRFKLWWKLFQIWLWQSLLLLHCYYRTSLLIWDVRFHGVVWKLGVASIRFRAIGVGLGPVCVDGVVTLLIHKKSLEVVGGWSFWFLNHLKLNLIKETH